MSRRVPTVPQVRGQRLAAANRLDELRTVGDELNQLETQLLVKRAKLQQLVHDAYAIDKTGPKKIGDAIGISRQRVRQIVQKVQEKGAPQ